MAEATVHPNTSTPHPGNTLGAYLAVGAKLESAALRARSIIRDVTLGGSP